MPQTFENPLGTDGFEFVEFTGPDPDKLEKLFRQLGFACVARHKSKDIQRFKQGDINLLLNREKGGQAEEFGKLRLNQDITDDEVKAYLAEAMVALVLAEAALEKFGGDSIAETVRNKDAYLAAIPEALRSSGELGAFEGTEGPAPERNA